MEKREATGRFQRRRRFRLTAEEDERLNRQAATTGISVSEYMRRLFFGGRPIIARRDDQAIRELRRLGGLLKHHFVVVERTGCAGALAGLDAALHLRCAGLYSRRRSERDFQTHPRPPPRTGPRRKDRLQAQIDRLCFRRGGRHRPCHSPAHTGVDSEIQP